MAAGITKTDNGWLLDPAVRGIAIDSRAVKPGFVFVAIPGFASDGHAFIDDAIKRGAGAVVGERPSMTIAVPYIQVPSSRTAAAELAAEFYHHPSQQLTTVGVTGTNGKTSVVYWMTALLRAGGYPSGMVSSVVNDTGSAVQESVLTTPESPELQRQLAEMRQSGMTHAVVEVSSHGIAQHRVDHIAWDLAVLTNITREHLDFHGTMENYVDTKAQLFERLPQASPGAILNADNQYCGTISRRIKAPVMTFGIESGDLRAEVLASTPWSSHVRLTSAAFTLTAELNHPGLYNVYNLAAAVAAAYRLGVSPQAMEAVIPQLPEVPGRMQVIQQPGKTTVIVDYAHTPDGLTQSLKTVRKMVTGHVWLVFGARGGRDRGKRPEMGRIAAELADHVVLTADSPNDEDPRDIAEAIAKGIREVDAGKLAHFEVQRDEAIRWAIREAGTTDCVLITGRGPEAYQNFRGQRIHLKDADVVIQALGGSVSKGADGVGIH